MARFGLPCVHHKSGEDPMLRCMRISPEGHVAIGGQELLAQERGAGAWLWLDLQDEVKLGERELLQAHFGLDALAINDAQRDRHPPKLEAYDDYIFMLLKGLDAGSHDIHHKTIQIALFVGTDFLVTRHSAESLSVNKLWARLAAGDGEASRGPLFWACGISRAVADRYGPVLLGLEERLDKIEDEIFNSRTDTLMEELVGYNTRVKKLRRVMAYHEGIFRELSRVEGLLAGNPMRHAFIDVHEQMERYASLASLYQELISDLVNGYISLNGHHLNQVMKVLTVVTVIFVPLTLLVGIYGMNFEYMPELKAEHGYQILLVVMGGIAVGLLTLFRKMRWL